MKQSYRAEVDGLRAIAVLAVIGFHAFPNRLSGGFVGVDIFFVISGFLITGIIQKELEAGVFSLAGFYARRIKRIFPALIAMSAGCMFIGALVLTTDEYKSLGRHIAAGAGFVANFALLQEIGYFDTAAELKPLLHLWSLGVEEQFYLLWPLLMVLFWRAKAGCTLIAVTVLALSFLWNLMLSSRDPAAAFYMPVTRFWELMLGALLAFTVRDGAEQNALIATARAAFGRLPDVGKLRLRNSAAAAGAAALAVAVVLFDRDQSYPSWWGLCPTIGAVLLIAAGREAWINRRFLSRPVLVYIGLISYPLYLWHWPILALERILRIKEPTDLMKLAGLAAAFILAELTYRFIERPVRFGSAKSYKPIAACVTLASIGCIGLIIGSSDYFQIGIANASGGTGGRDMRIEVTEAYRTGTCFLVNEVPSSFAPECGGAREADVQTILLWGDSHAAHLYPGLREWEKRDATVQIAQYAAAACPPIVSFLTENKPNCALINDFVLARIQQLRPRIVIMAAHWWMYGTPGPWGEDSESAVRKTVERLKEQGVERVVGIGQFPLWDAVPSRIRSQTSRLSNMDIFAQNQGSPPPDRGDAFLNRSMFEVDRKIESVFEAAGAVFIAPRSLLCSPEGCLLVVPGTAGEMMAWDNSHLTKAGSSFFVDSNMRNILGR